MSDEIDVKVSGQDPRSPYYGQLLSTDDEKRLDDKGRPVVSANASPWGTAGTNLFLVVYGRQSKVVGLSPIKDVDTTAFDLGKHRKVGVGVSRGRPVIAADGVYGACLELPFDLAQDPHKVEYVTAWLGSTTLEVMELLGGVPKPRMTKAILRMSEASEAHIKAAGL